MISAPRILLLVEDNAADAGLATEAAAWFGLDGEIAWVNDGAEAMAWVRNHVAEGRPCPHLIVLDLNLPRVSGHDFLAQLRAGGECTDSAVVVLSSSNRDEDRNRALAGGACRYLVKPKTWDAYLETFREIVDAWSTAR